MARCGLAYGTTRASGRRVRIRALTFDGGEQRNTGLDEAAMGLSGDSDDDDEYTPHISSKHPSKHRMMSVIDDVTAALATTSFTHSGHQQDHQPSAAQRHQSSRVAMSTSATIGAARQERSPSAALPFLRLTNNGSLRFGGSHHHRRAPPHRGGGGGGSGSVNSSSHHILNGTGGNGADSELHSHHGTFGGGGHRHGAAKRLFLCAAASPGGERIAALMNRGHLSRFIASCRIRIWCLPH